MKCNSTWAADASAASRLGSTDGLIRGQDCVDTGAPVSVPVGEETLGRVFNLLGEPVDGRGEVEADGTLADSPRLPRASTNCRPSTELFETGIKVIDLLTPFVRGGKAGLFGGAGLGKTVILTELIARIASRPTVVTRCSPASANEPVKEPTSGWKCRKPRSVTPAAA